MPTTEEYYIEDFKCFRHYVLCYQKNKYDYGLLSLNTRNKDSGDISTLVTEYKKYNKSELYDNTYYRVVIFENIETIKTADFYIKESSDWNKNYVYFKNKRINKDIPKDYKHCTSFLYFKKLNYQWKVKDISKNYQINIDGTIINYRIATVTIPKEAAPIKRYRIPKKKIE